MKMNVGTADSVMRVFGILCISLFVVAIVVKMYARERVHHQVGEGMKNDLEGLFDVSDLDEFDENGGI